MFARDPSFRLLERWGAFRRVWLGVPLVIHLWMLAAPFVGDDLHMVVRAEQFVRGERDRPGLFDFGATTGTRQELIDRGTLPWWSPPECTVGFLRPLAEWSWLGDVALFGRSPVGHRLLSLTWFVVALLCVHGLFRVVSGDGTRAGLATLFFGISQPATNTLTLVSNRSDILVVVGVSLAAWAYWSARRAPRGRLALCAAAAFGFALLAKETALPLAGVVLLHEVWRRFRSQPEPAAISGAVHAGLLLAMAIAYLSYYAATQPAVGRIASAGTELATCAAQWTQSLGLYAAMWTTGLPVHALYFVSTGWLVSATAILGGVLWGVCLWYIRRNASGDVGVAFFAIWTACFLALALLTLPEPRALCVATVGWSYLVAAFLVPGAASRRAAPVAVRHALLFASGAASIVSSAASFGVQVHLDRRISDRLAAHVAGLSPPLASGETLIIAEADYGFDVLFASDRLEYLTGLRDLSAAYLTLAEARATFLREDRHTLRARSASPQLFGSLFHRLVLGPRFRPRIGMRYGTRDFSAEIAAMEDDVVTELRFVFREPMESARLRFAPEALDRTARATQSAPGEGVPLTTVAR